MSEEAIVTIYADGGCRGNPGPGGWGVVLQSGEHAKELWGGEVATTNNRMELTAAIEGLAALKRSTTVRFYTDSLYVRDGITRWINGWRRNGWRTADKKPVKNVDLWTRLDELIAQHRIDWNWVRGHSGHPENERADALARAAAEAARADARRERGD